jgi:hypothetical protein
MRSASGGDDFAGSRSSERVEAIQRQEPAMSTPFVTETTRAIEPVEHDSFIDDLPPRTVLIVPPARRLPALTRRPPDPVRVPYGPA